MESVEERDELEDVTEPWADAYDELMGEEDEVDVFFILPRVEASLIEPDPEELDDLLVLRVMGLPENELAWVH